MVQNLESPGLSERVDSPVFMVLRVSQQLQKAKGTKKTVQFM